MTSKERMKVFTAIGDPEYLFEGLITKIMANISASRTMRANVAMIFTVVIQIKHYIKY